MLLPPHNTHLTLYADPEYLPPGKTHTILLYPFWGNPEAQTQEFYKDRFQDYVINGKSLFTIAKTPEHADYFLLPFEYANDSVSLDYTHKLLSLARRYNKKVLIFFNSDSDESIALQDVIIFRTSFSRSSRTGCEFAFPAWMEDFFYSHQIVPGKKTAYPIISYCGYVDFVHSDNYIHEISSSARRLFNKVVRRRSTDIGCRLRGKAVRKLIRNKRVRLNFLRRDGFWAPGVEKNRARQEYIDNMLSADYALVTRGAGNFSYRFYEALSSARIPVFIDTDCVLPFDHIIDWKKYVLWIDEEDISKLDTKLLEFHSNITDQQLYELKLSIRKLYERWLTPLAFFANLSLCIDLCETQNQNLKEHKS